jgi:hypothetical protein
MMRMPSIGGALSQNMSHSAALVCALLLAALALQPAHAADDFFESDAQTPSPITDRFALQASFFHASVNTQLRADPPGDPQAGTHLSATPDLGFRPHENDGLAELVFRLRERNRITADYMELDQSATTTLTRPIVFGYQNFNAGDVMASSLQWRTMGLTWTYALIQNDRFELGAGLGVHLMDLDVRGAVQSRFETYQTSIAGALPTPALESAWRITRRFSVTAHGQYLKGTLKGTSAVVGNFHADVQFRWVPNLAIGAGYSVSRLELNSVTQDNPGLVGIRLQGPEAFLRVSF